MLLLALLGIWYASGVRYVFTTNDDFCYATMAIDLAEGRPLTRHFPSSILAVPFVRVGGEDSTYACRHPFGVSALLAPLYAMGGYRALFWLRPPLALAGIAALYLLARRLTGSFKTSLTAAGLLATVPPLYWHAGIVGSDVASLALVTAALYLYACELRAPGGRWLAASALFCGVAFLVRNPNIVVFAAIVLHQLLIAGARLRLVTAAAIVAVFVVLQAAFNFQVTGSMLGGYGEKIAADGFSAMHLIRHLPGYLIVLCTLPPLGLVAIAVVARRRRHDADGVFVLLAGIAAAYVVVYAAWWHFAFDPQRGFVEGSRFVLPIVPLLCLGLAVALRDAIASPVSRRLAVAAILSMQLAASLFLAREAVAFKQRMEALRDRIYAVTAPGALVIGPGDWRKLLFAEGAEYEASRRIYAAHDRAPDSPVAALEMARSWRARGAPVYLLVREPPGERARQLLDQLAAESSLAPVAGEREPYAMRAYRVN